MPFKLRSEFKPTGDQPQAIESLVASLNAGNRDQTLLGVTGSGKTFTVANVIARLGRPALVISHNKTLAAQLYSEFRGFFPENAVEYFVSYYDYYQPEAYVPSSDTFIDKDSSINEEIERLRISTTSSLVEPARRDRRCKRVLHLRPRVARRLHRNADSPPPGGDAGPRGPAPAPGGQPL